MERRLHLNTREQSWGEAVDEAAVGWQWHDINEGERVCTVKVFRSGLVGPGQVRSVRARPQGLS